MTTTETALDRYIILTEQESVISARTGRAVWIFGLSDRTPATLLTYRTKDVGAAAGLAPVAGRNHGEVSQSSARR